MRYSVIILILALFLTSCAKSKRLKDGNKYRPYGLLNENSCKNDSVYYEVSGWAVFSGVVFSECLFIPTIYTFGYNLWEPVCFNSELRDHPKEKGMVR